MDEYIEEDTTNILYKINKNLEKINEKLINLESKIENIEKKIDSDIVDECKKMGNHINFIENVYENVKHPLGYINTKIKKLIGNEESYTLNNISYNNHDFTNIDLNGNNNNNNNNNDNNNNNNNTNNNNNNNNNNN